MCTLSVVKTVRDVIVTMNRDEHRQRHEADNLTEIKNESGNRVIFPTDTRSGGSWFGISETGVVLALLNRYQDPLKSDVVSRGEIIPNALACNDFDSIFDFCGTIKTESYNPFDLILISTNDCYQFKWDGIDYKIIPISIEEGFFITSSSVDMEKVLSWRNQFFKQWLAEQSMEKIDKQMLIAEIHFNQLADDKSRSVFMSREHSHTKSISQVSLSETELDFYYFPESSLLDLSVTDNFHTDGTCSRLCSRLLPLQQ